MYTRYDDYGHAYQTTWWAENREVFWWAVALILAFALIFSAFIMTERQEAEEAKTSVMQDIGTTVTIDGVQYSVRQFLPSGSFGRNATFVVNTLSGKLYVTYNANAFRGSEKTLDTGLTYEIPATS